MNICFLMLSEGWAGAESALYNLLLNYPNKKKDKIFLFINSEIYNHYKYLENIHVINLGNLFVGGKLNKFLNLLKLRKRFKQYLIKYRLRYISNFLSLSSTLYYGISDNLEIKTIFNLRGTEINNYLNNKNILNSIFVGRAINNSIALISVSNHQIKNLPEKYKKKTVVIPNGVDSKLFKPSNIIKQKKNVVLFVGRIINDKGINEILSVARQLPQYEFWFAGKGDLENKINLPNTKRLGIKNSKELVKLYNQATICILPSYHEGFSNVGLETISCGRALICTPDFSEYIKNGEDGIIIPIKDEKALKNAIVELMNNGKKRKIIENNARKKALHYSWKNVSKNYMKFFEEVIGE